MDRSQGDWLGREGGSVGAKRRTEAQRHLENVCRLRPRTWWREKGWRVRRVKSPGSRRSKRALTSVAQ